VGTNHNRIVVLSSVENISGRVADADHRFDFPITLVADLTGAFERWLGTVSGSLTEILIESESHYITHHHRWDADDV